MGLGPSIRRHRRRCRGDGTPEGERASTVPTSGELSRLLHRTVDHDLTYLVDRADDADGGAKGPTADEGRGDAEEKGGPDAVRREELPSAPATVPTVTVGVTVTVGRPSQNIVMTLTMAQPAVATPAPAPAPAVPTPAAEPQQQPAQPGFIPVSPSAGDRSVSAAPTSQTSTTTLQTVADISPSPAPAAPSPAPSADAAPAAPTPSREPQQDPQQLEVIIVSPSAGDRSVSAVPTSQLFTTTLQTVAAISPSPALAAPAAPSADLSPAPLPPSITAGSLSRIPGLAGILADQIAASEATQTSAAATVPQGNGSGAVVAAIGVSAGLVIALLMITCLIFRCNRKEKAEKAKKAEV